MQDPSALKTGNRCRRLQTESTAAGGGAVDERDLCQSEEDSAKLASMSLEPEQQRQASPPEMKIAKVDVSAA